MTLKICFKCNTEFDDYSKWGPKKYCSRKCANSRPQTKEIRESKSKKLQKPTTCKYCNTVLKSVSGAGSHEKSCLENPNRLPGSFFEKNHTLETKLKQGQKNGMGLRTPKSLLDMSKRTSSKIMKRLDIGCFICEWKLGSCDIHHILPVSKGGSDDNSNLTYICPNCHRLAHEDKLTDFISVTEKIGEEWRKFYFAHE
jgi:hypothetical protein